MSQKCQSCASCGMPMQKKEDFAQGDTSQIYCRHCTDERGRLLPFDAVLKVNAKFYVDSQGVTPKAAAKMARDLLMKQPAWKGIRA